jgi:AraC-like DNA-binding protein
MRVLYVDTTVLPESRIGPAVDRPAIPDATLRARVSALHDALACPDDALEAETRFAFVAERIRASLGAPDAPPPRTGDRLAAEALRNYLDARPFVPLTLTDAARHIGWSPAYAARAFTTIFGIPPHTYIIGRRLDAARDRILSGSALSAVATEVGFFDQAHMTRRFRRFLGTTPSRFAHAAG